MPTIEMGFLAIAPAGEKTGNQQVVARDLHLRWDVNACQAGLYLTHQQRYNLAQRGIQAIQSFL